MTTPVPPVTIRDRVAAFLAAADGMPAADVALALDEEGLLAPDRPAVTRERAAATLADLADAHTDNADVYLDNPEKARQAYRRARLRIVTSPALEPDHSQQQLADAWTVLDGGGRA